MADPLRVGSEENGRKECQSGQGAKGDFFRLFCGRLTRQLTQSFCELTQGTRIVKQTFFKKEVLISQDMNGNAKVWLTWVPVPYFWTANKSHAAISHPLSIMNNGLTNLIDMVPI